jgi:hypothetical protein
MTTPAAMNSILENLRERIADAEREAGESHKAAHNSYGAGYDRGFADALNELLTDITGETS